MRKLRTQVLFLTLSLVGVLMAKHYVSRLAAQISAFAGD